MSLLWSVRVRLTDSVEYVEIAVGLFYISKYD
ncbi:hypothetical protein SAMN06265347_11924 [Halobellus salinus]|nr:hypothetical protein SAMN06265347_11924 [Halobellus salinus]